MHSLSGTMVKGYFLVKITLIIASCNATEIRGGFRPRGPDLKKKINMGVLL